jgi:hypothetical protein
VAKKTVISKKSVSNKTAPKKKSTMNTSGGMSAGANYLAIATIAATVLWLR